MSKQETLIEKLDKELARNGRFNNWDLGFQNAIEIVRQHNEWISTDEQLPYAEEMQPVKVCAVSCSLSKRQTVWMLESKDTREKALQQIYEWVKEDFVIQPT